MTANHLNRKQLHSDDLMTGHQRTYTIASVAGRTKHHQEEIEESRSSTANF